MKIDELFIENWKCFDSYVHLDFANIEVFSFPNGSGKTAVLEAMFYGIFGKVDGKLASYQNHDGQTKVSVGFTCDDGSQYYIKREFPLQKSNLYKNGELIKKSIREIFEYVDEMLDCNLTKRLWFKGDICSSDILNFDFFKNKILEEQLKDPILLLHHYTKSMNIKKKELNSIPINECRKIHDIDEDIKRISEKIKGKTAISDVEYSKALKALNASKKIEELNQKNFKEVSSKDSIRWNSIDSSKTMEELEREKNKPQDQFLSVIGMQAAKSIMNANDNACKCLVCGGVWADDRSKELSDAIKSGLQDKRKIEKLEENLAFKNSFDEEDINFSKELLIAKSDIAAMPQYKEKIAKFDSDVNNLWEKLDSLNSERDISVRSEFNLSRAKELEKEINDLKGKIAFIKDYLEKATASLTSSTMKEASKILNSINNNYNDIQVDEGSISVNVKGRLLPVCLLSRGEKTMVALSLIITIRDIFSPGMPLIFDESFAALSAKNNENVIEIISESFEQVFIVSHDKAWVEALSNKTDIDANIRTEW